MRKILLFAVVASFGLFGTVQAHNGEVVIDSLELGQDYFWNHDDESPWKGLAEVTVTNTGQDPWGDFHFEIYDGWGGDATSVVFLDFSMGGVDPTSTQIIDDWTIGTTPDGYSFIDLFFYNDWVLPGQTATFTVYTDNTAGTLSWFGMKIYPTPVPEPTTMALLGLGAMAVLRRKVR